MLIGTDDLVATTLDSTALECISYEQGHFPTEQYNLENEEVNIATLHLSNPQPLVLAVVLKMPFIAKRSSPRLYIAHLFCIVCLILMLTHG